MNNDCSDTFDIAGTPILNGDTVVTVNGQSTGRVCEIRREDDIDFICLRPVHQAYGKGVWYASDQVFWVARPAAAKTKESGTGADRPGRGVARVGRTEPAKKK